MQVLMTVTWNARKRNHNHTQHNMAVACMSFLQSHTAHIGRMHVIPTITYSTWPSHACYFYSKIREHRKTYILLKVSNRRVLTANSAAYGKGTSLRFRFNCGYKSDCVLAPISFKADERFASIKWTLSLRGLLSNKTSTIYSDPLAQKKAYNTAVSKTVREP